MSKIFLSYRRQDSAGVAGRIYDRLRAHFGDDAIFMDIDAIPIGVDFRQHITSALDQCGVLLAVIGRHWAGEVGAPGRIDDPRDFVRIEIESALDRKLPVVPILIDRARMPAETDLPPSLAPLAYRNAIEVDQGRDFHHHVDRLIEGIEYHLRVATASPENEWTNTLGMTLKLIPAGEFLMGSPESDKDAENDEKPQHRVRITQPFYLSVYQVTRGQFRQFVDSARYKTEAEKDGKGGWGLDVATGKWVQNRTFTWRAPGFDQTDDHPVVNVSRNDASAFCEWVSQTEGQSYRLPTEAEWEYACRAGSKTRYGFGDVPNDLPSFAWFADNSGGVLWDSERFWDDSGHDGEKYAAQVACRGCRTHPVGQKRTNAFGLYDMHGNVWEWCRDLYDADHYKQSVGANPREPERAVTRAIRGGSWYYGAQRARSAFRGGFTPGYRFSDLGFRPARVQSGRCAK
jgi:formylglycine-generating enzyme required for sulfatase activity